MPCEDVRNTERNTPEDFSPGIFFFLIFKNKLQILFPFINVHQRTLQIIKSSSFFKNYLFTEQITISYLKSQGSHALLVGLN